MRQRMEQFNLNSMRLLAGACVGTLPTGVVYPATLTFNRGSVESRVGDYGSDRHRYSHVELLITPSIVPNGQGGNGEMR